MRATRRQSDAGMLRHGNAGAAPVPTSPRLRVSASAVSAISALLLSFSAAQAHPVPRNAHDRVVIVRLTPEAVLVEYHLEVDEWTVVFKDVPALLDKDELGKLKTPKEFYDTFARNYAPLLGGLLDGKLDDHKLEFECMEQTHKLADSLQCDFVF